MEKKKAIVIVLLCTVILENICEGSPVRTQFTKNFSYITPADRVLADVMLESMKKEHERPHIVPTTIPTLEEAPNPPESADHLTTNESQKATPAEVKSDLAKSQDKYHASSRLSTLTATQPSLEEGLETPNSVDQTGDESRGAIPKQFKSDRKMLRGTYRDPGRFPTLTAPKPFQEQASGHPDSVHQSTDGPQQDTLQEANSHLAMLQRKHRANGRLRSPLATKLYLEEEDDHHDSEYQSADRTQQAIQQETKSHLAKFQGKHRVRGRVRTLLATKLHLKQTVNPPDFVHQATDVIPNDLEFKSDHSRVQGKHREPGRQSTISAPQPPLEETLDSSDSVYQTAGKSQRATPQEAKSHLATFQEKHRVHDESQTQTVIPEEFKSDRSRVQGKRRDPGRQSTISATQPLLEETQDPPDSVYQTAGEYQEALPKKVKSYLTKLQGKHRVRSRPRTLFVRKPHLEDAASDARDHKYQSTEGPQQAAQEKMESHFAKLKGYNDPGRLPTVLAAKQRLEELPVTPYSTYQEKDQFRTTSDEVKSEEFNDKEQASFRGNREHPLPKDSPKVSRHVGRSTGRGTSAALEIGTHVRPAMVKTSSIRWHVAHLQKSKDDNTHHKRKKKKKPHDPTASGSALIVAGIAAGILVLLCVVAGVMQLCKKCRRRSRAVDDPELGKATPPTKNAGETVRDEETVFETEGTGHKKEVSKKKTKRNSKARATSPSKQPNNYKKHAPTTESEASEVISCMHASSTTGITEAGVWIVNETSGSPSSPVSQTPTSEPSTWTPNESSPSTPGNASSGSYLTSESDSWTFPETAKLAATPRLPTSTPTSSAENVTNVDETASEHLELRDAPVASTRQPEVPNMTSAQSSGLAKNSGELVASSKTADTNSSNSSSESCKTPVAPLNEVIITIEDDEEIKLVLLSSNECSSGELLYTSGHSGTQNAMDINGNVSERDNENKSLIGSEYESSSGELIYTSEPTKAKTTTIDTEMVTSSMMSSVDEPPSPPPPVSPPKVSTELKLGKAAGGRKAKENRSFIKHLTSGDYSSGFHGDLKVAVSKILIKNERFADKNKEKRMVVKEQTKETGRSMKESIVLGKTVIMNENVDNIRNKRCASRRRVIRKGLSPPPDSTLQPHTSLSQEIAFAQSVILPGFIHKKTTRERKERCMVMKELVNEVKGPSFENRLLIAASTINPAEEIRDANAKGCHKRSVIRMDSEMMKLRGKKSTFRADIQFVRNVICGPPAVDHENNPQMGCLCYHCKKYWTKTGGPPCFKLPSAISISKDIVLMDGKLFFFKPKTAHARFHSKIPSNSYPPSNSSQGTQSGSNGN